MPATDAALESLENTLGFGLPAHLKSILRDRDGDSRIGIESCCQMECIDIACCKALTCLVSVRMYKETQVAYTLLDWIPILSHGNNDVWDCLDVVGGFMVRVSVLPEDIENEINTGYLFVSFSGFVVPG